MHTTQTHVIVAIVFVLLLVQTCGVRENLHRRRGNFLARSKGKIAPKAQKKKILVPPWTS